MKLANLGAMAIALAAAFGASSQARAEWILVSDFTGLTDPNKVNNGSGGGWYLHEQGGWSTLAQNTLGNTTAYTAQDTPAPGGLHLGFAPLAGGNESSGRRTARIALPTNAQIANNATGTLFFRFFAEADGSFAKIQVGLNSTAAPTASKHAGVAFRVQADSNSIFYGPEHNSNAILDSGGSRGVWHNVWLVIDNAADKVDMYMTTGSQSAVSATPVMSQGDFSNATTDTLQTLILIQNTASTSPSDVRFRFDDFYMSSGTNLANPVPEPAAHGLLLLGGMVLGPMLRSRRAGWALFRSNARGK